MGIGAWLGNGQVSATDVDRTAVDVVSLSSVDHQGVVDCPDRTAVVKFGGDKAFARAGSSPFSVDRFAKINSRE